MCVGLCAKLRNWANVLKHPVYLQYLQKQYKVSSGSKQSLFSITKFYKFLTVLTLQG